MPFAAETLSEFAVNLALVDIPDDVIDYTKKLIADTLAASVLGARMPWSAAIREASIASRPHGQSSIIGLEQRFSASCAAFVNGSCAHANDFDDFYAYGPLHPSAAVWVALPVGEETNASGADVITNVVVGYEICARLAEACFSGPKQEKALVERGFHGQPVCGVLAAAAQTARMLRLPSSVTASALGIAGSYAGGLMQFMQEPADTKRFHFGKASSEGIMAAQLAARGFRGPKSIIEGRKGLLNAIAGEWVESKLTERLGSQYYITSAFLKPVSTMGGNFGCYEAMCQIVEEHGLVADSIDCITAELRSQFTGYSIGLGDSAIAAHYAPPDRYSAEMSLPYLIALVALFGRELMPQHFDREYRSDPRLLTIARRVTVNFPPDIDNISRREAYSMGRVTVKTNDGRTLTKTVTTPSGDPRRPLSWDRIRSKLLACGEGALEPPEIDRLLETISRLERVQEIEALTSSLRRVQASPWPGEAAVWVDSPSI